MLPASHKNKRSFRVAITNNKSPKKDEDSRILFDSVDGNGKGTLNASARSAANALSRKRKPATQNPNGSANLNYHLRRTFREAAWYPRRNFWIPPGFVFYFETFRTSSQR